jgi:hypothetical protein
MCCCMILHFIGAHRVFCVRIAKRTTDFAMNCLGQQLAWIRNAQPVRKAGHVCRVMREHH